MTCRECSDLLMDYLDGTIPDADHVRFDAHLGECPPCVRYLVSYQETIRISRAAFSDADAAHRPEVPDELVRAILQTVGKQSEG
jgi:anti-sigma factor RsiW